MCTRDVSRPVIRTGRVRNGRVVGNGNTIVRMVLTGQKYWVGKRSFCCVCRRLTEDSPAYPEAEEVLADHRIVFDPQDRGKGHLATHYRNLSGTGRRIEGQGKLGERHKQPLHI